MRPAIIVAFIAWSAVAAPPSTCDQRGDEYARALCAYQKRDFPAAEDAFSAIVQRNESDPRTIRALYFLARTKMKRGSYEEASSLLIRIYSLDRPFYDAWSCDYLLGECRKAMGRE